MDYFWDIFRHVLGVVDDFLRLFVSRFEKMALKDECMDEKKFVKSGGIYRGDLTILV